MRHVQLFADLLVRTPARDEIGDTSLGFAEAVPPERGPGQTSLHAHSWLLSRPAAAETWRSHRGVLSRYESRIAPGARVRAGVHHWSGLVQYPPDATGGGLVGTRGEATTTVSARARAARALRVLPLDATILIGRLQLVGHGSDSLGATVEPAGVVRPTTPCWRGSRVDPTSSGTSALLGSGRHDRGSARWSDVSSSLPRRVLDDRFLRVTRREGAPALRLGDPARPVLHHVDATRLLLGHRSPLIGNRHRGFPAMSKRQTPRTNHNQGGRGADLIRAFRMFQSPFTWMSPAAVCERPIAVTMTGIRGDAPGGSGSGTCRRFRPQPGASLRTGAPSDDGRRASAY